MKLRPVVPDRVVALEAMMEAKGTPPPKPPRCLDYANCCHCPACQRREDRLRARLFGADYLQHIGFDDQPEEELLAA